MGSNERRAINGESAVCADAKESNSVDAKREGEGVDLGLLLRMAVKESTLEHQLCAKSVRMKGDHWSKVLESERGITLEQLGSLPIPVQRAWLMYWAAEIGLRLDRRRDNGEMRALAQALKTAAAAIDAVS